jgi:hypothetical protein
MIPAISSRRDYDVADELVIVRPDGYVGIRATPADEELLTEYPERILPQTGSHRAI